MALFKRGSGWWMRFNYQGKQFRKPTGTANRKLAERIYHKVLGQIAEGKWFEKLPGEERLFRELMEKYMVEHSRPNKAPNSHIRDKSLSAHLLKAFADLPLARITPKLIAEYKPQRRKEGAAPATINRELSLMGHVYNMGIKEWEWVADNPVSRVSKEKVRNTIERWLTLEEEEELLAASPAWLRQMIVLVLHTGLRQGEVLGLKWSQIDLFRKTLIITEQKNQGVDTLPLNETAMEVLKARTKVRHIRCETVFYNGSGKRMDARNLLRVFYGARKKAKLEDFRFHDLRHTWATRLVQAGVDLYTVQRLGRWKTISMVMRYAHHCTESLRPGALALDQLQRKSSTNLAQSEQQRKHWKV